MEKIRHEITFEYGKGLGIFILIGIWGLAFGAGICFRLGWKLIGYLF